MFSVLICIPECLDAHMNRNVSAFVYLEIWSYFFLETAEEKKGSTEFHINEEKARAMPLLITSTSACMSDETMSRSSDSDDVADQKMRARQSCGG